MMMMMSVDGGGLDRRRGGNVSGELSFTFVLV